MDLPLDNPLFWLLAIVGVILTGLSKSGLAGGAGVLAVPLLAFMVPVPVAAAITLPLLWVMDIRTIMAFKDSISWHDLVGLIPAAFIGVLIASVSMSYMNHHHLLLVLGLVSILFALWQSLSQWFAQWAGAGILWGAIAGFTSTLLHAGGPPISIYFLGRKLSKDAWLASAAVFFGVLNMVKALPYTLNNQWSSEQWLVSAILIPVAWFGVILGVWLSKHINEVLFVNIARCMLGLVGVLLLYKWYEQ